MDNKVKVNTRTVQEVEGITLTLSLREAIAIALLTGNCTGSYEGFRGDTSEIYEKLRLSGIDIQNLNHLAEGRIDILKDTEEDAKVIEKIRLELLDRASGDVSKMNSPELIRLVKQGVNRLAAIKELRAIASELGFPQGLKEAKEEVDRRFQEANAKRYW